MHLGVKGNRLILTFDRDIAIDPDPEDYYLVRWWINGRPFIPDPLPPDGMQASAGSGAAVIGRRLDFVLKFHPELLHAKKGDTIAVQMLRCARGWSYTGPVEMAELQRASAPDEDEIPFIARLSNRAEFTYTGDPASMAKP
jgi:hypothetical protein